MSRICRTLVLDDDGLVKRAMTEVDLAAESTKNFRKGGGPSDRVFFAVGRSGQVKCWKKTDYEKFVSQTHGLLTNVLTDAQLDSLPRGVLSRGMVSKQVDTIMNPAEMLSYSITHDIVSEGLLAASTFKKERKEKKERRRVTGAAKPRKALRKREK